VKRKLQVESGKKKLLRTREEVRRGWLAVSDELTRQGHGEIAAQVRRYVEQMPRPLTDMGGGRKLHTFGGPKLHTR
jgi:hypothetical protein